MLLRSALAIALLFFCCLVASPGLHVYRAEAELTSERASRVKAEQITADTQKEVSLLATRLAEAHEQVDAKQLKLEHAQRQVSLVSSALSAANPEQAL